MFGQVEPSVDQRPSPAGCVGEEDADLTDLDTSGGHGVLPLHARRGPAFLHEAGLVDDQHSTVAAEAVYGVYTPPSLETRSSISGGLAIEFVTVQWDTTARRAASLSVGSCGATKVKDREATRAGRSAAIRN